VVEVDVGVNVQVFPGNPQGVLVKEDVGVNEIIGVEVFVAVGVMVKVCVWVGVWELWFSITIHGYLEDLVLAVR